jgi:hypothetical protein
VYFANGQTDRTLVPYIIGGWPAQQTENSKKTTDREREKYKRERERERESERERERDGHNNSKPQRIAEYRTAKFAIPGLNPTL